MDDGITNSEPRQRYPVEHVARFVEQALAHQPKHVQRQWSWLPARIRQHWAPFFWVTPSTKIIDLVKNVPGRAE